MEKRWTIKRAADTAVRSTLKDSLNVDDVIAGLLAQRDIKSYEEAKDFFRPSVQQLHDPFLMKDMDAAITRIEKAIQAGEKILIYGDFDVDGTTAVALVYSFFKKKYNNIDFYIPDRYAEGYGISFKGIDFAKENGFTLVIALDCGIKANDKIDYANKSKIDFVICDHHRTGNELPKAVAVLDPKRSDCTYPYDELSGCGIGFKLIQGYAQKNNISFDELATYLDLVVISIGADIVPITGENRILAYYGLKQINSSPRLGIKTLLELNNIKRELTISDLVFILGPRINAAGRIDSGRKAVELLVSGNKEAAIASSEFINSNNLQRRDIDVSITQQALALMENDETLTKRKTTVLFNASWHKGVIGIVASRMIEKYYRPTIILTESNGMATGSARSVKDFDVYQAIDACSHLLEQFGGHKYAAGLTLKMENIEAFTQKFEEVVSTTIAEHLLIPEVEIDSVLKLSDINPKFYRVLKQFAPFGPGNMSPVFMTENILDKGMARMVGTNHLKLDIYNPENPTQIISAIGFGFGKYVNEVLKNKPFKICYAIEENEWNGNITLQLNIKDLKFE